MSVKSSIEWTDASWNPIRGVAPNRHMCRKISPGCDNCYASGMNYRFGGQEYKFEGAGVGEVRLDEKALLLPLTWKQTRRVFVCSMTDLFGDWVPDEWIVRMFEVMRRSSQHQFQVLTKRPTRMLTVVQRYYGREIASFPGSTPLPNVWLGTSIELDRYTWRANVLRECPSAVRFVSAEPLLGPLPSLDLTGIDWLITGGESGGPAERRLVERCDHFLPDHRYWTSAEHCYVCASHAPTDDHIPLHGGTGWRPRDEALEWVRDLRDRSLASGTAFFHKQWGGTTHAKSGRLLDGRTWDEYPQALAVPA